MDDLRDRLLYDRISALLKPLEAEVLPFPENGVFAKELSAATMGDLRRMSGMVVLSSPEGLRNWAVQQELYWAGQFGTPTCLLLYPGVAPPGWATEPVACIPLEGFKDSGPGLPPGTDERQIFQSSRFAGRTLSSLLAFVRGVRDGSRLAMPAIPRPGPIRLLSRLGL